MPYGVDKELGGDNPKNDSWMEKCVDSVMKGGKSKGSAIAICKEQMRKNKSKSSFNEEDTAVEKETLAEFDVAMQNCAKVLLDTGVVESQREAADWCENLFAETGNSRSLELFLSKKLFTK